MLPGSLAHTHAGRLAPASRPPLSPARKSNPHSARRAAGAKLPATSCLGAFWTPAARARGISSLSASKNLYKTGCALRRLFRLQGRRAVHSDNPSKPSCWCARQQERMGGHHRRLAALGGRMEKGICPGPSCAIRFILPEVQRSPQFRSARLHGQAFEFQAWCSRAGPPCSRTYRGFRGRSEVGHGCP